MRRFFSVTKPGIIFGNAVTLCGGFFLGSQRFHLGLLLAALLGMSLVIASGCVFNNLIDRDIDSLMERTKNRVLVHGLISTKIAILYAIVLGLLGFLILYLFTNPLTLLFSAIGVLVYVGAYSLYFKRKSNLGTIVGGVAGAVPPVVGYCAASGRFDLGAVLLFVILFLWQLPHFYAISIYRLGDYKAAAIPVLPLRKNIHYTKMSMLIYIAAFTLATMLPSFFGYAGLVYLIAVFGLGVTWFCLGLRGLSTTADKIWARKMFLFSIINITLLCIMMAVK